MRGEKAGSRALGSEGCRGVVSCDERSAWIRALAEARASLEGGASIYGSESVELCIRGILRGVSTDLLDRAGLRQDCEQVLKSFEVREEVNAEVGTEYTTSKQTSVPDVQ